LGGLDVHLNLIPFNPIEGAEHLQPSDELRSQAFSAALKAAGMRVTTRYSLGADIAAACGQLVRRENQARGRLVDPVVA
jgi:23S rRNA (adenine2503-C2)-methyltransferase